MKKRYVVSFSSPFQHQHGYFIYVWFLLKPKEIKIEGNPLLSATKFKWKWIADMFCRAMQKDSYRKLDLKTWGVVEYTKDELDEYEKYYQDKLKVDKFNQQLDDITQDPLKIDGGGYR